jgi:hypothetical protein
LDVRFIKIVLNLHICSFIFLTGGFFFYTLHGILACIDEVTELQPIPEAHVPVMKFKFDGISIDLLYASISCLIVPEVSGIFFIFYLVPLSNVPGWKVQPYYALPIPFSFSLHLRFWMGLSVQ